MSPKISVLTVFRPHLGLPRGRERTCWKKRAIATAERTVSRTPVAVLARDADATKMRRVRPKIHKLANTLGW